MQLKLTRSRREGGLVSKSVIFCLDARVDFTKEEQHSINYYKLGNECVYSSEAAMRHHNRADQLNDGSVTGALKSIASTAMAGLQLNIKIAGLQKGQHIECKTMEELLAAEDAIRAGCKNLKAYLAVAASFDGRPILVNYDDIGTEMTVVGAVPQAAIAAMPSAPSADLPIREVLRSLAPPPPDSIARGEEETGAFRYTAASHAEDEPEDVLGLGRARALAEGFWQNATTAQRGLVGLGGLILLYLVLHAL